MQCSPKFLKKSLVFFIVSNLVIHSLHVLAYMCKVSCFHRYDLVTPL